MRPDYRANAKARSLTDEALSERLETGARLGALDTLAGRAYVREAHKRKNARRTQLTLEIPITTIWKPKEAKQR
jgi:hypothetical protein